MSLILPCGKPDKISTLFEQVLHKILLSFEQPQIQQFSLYIKDKNCSNIKYSWFLIKLNIKLNIFCLEIKGF